MNLFFKQIGNSRNTCVGQSHCRFSVHYLLLIALLIGMGGASQAQVESRQAEEAGKQDRSDLSEVLKLAMRDMAQGHFDQAREQLANTSGMEGRYVRLANGLLSQYESLQAEVLETYHEAYDTYLEAMNDALEHAEWREMVLKESKASQLVSDAKTEFEDDLRKKIKGHCLKALGQMSLAKSLAQRVGLDNTIDAELQKKIITASLEIAEGYEAEKKWLESYGRVYSYLVALDEENQDYEDHTRRLIRQASLVNMYISDPNQESVSWEERREGITFSMISRGLGQLHHHYVEPPDYLDMILKGLEYCRYLGETAKLAETFTSLADKDLVNKFLSELDQMAELAKTREPEQLNHTQVLEFLRQVQLINEDSIALPDEVILAEYAEGAFSSLDGYTYLIWPSDVADFKKDMTNEFFGIGIEIGKPKGLLTVTSLLEGNPAMRAGLDAGDLIMAIDGKSTSNITMEMAVKRITGPKGTDVVLTIDRQGFDEPRDFTVTRDRIVVHTVRGLWRDESGQWQHFVDRNQGIAYIQIKSFSGETSASFRAILEQLKQEKLKGLIVDLRRNSGGYLSAAVEVVDNFVATGPIVSTRPRDPKLGHMDSAQAQGTFRSDIPLVVLVDSMSASASEIVSGALQDHHRALIVGSRTFGKGSVQTIQKLWPSQAEMKMTIAYYYLPSNRRVHRDPKDKANKDYGVPPDLTMELTNKQLLEQYEVHRDAAILHQNGDAGDHNEREMVGVEELLASDPALRLALLCLNADLAAQAMDQAQATELVMN